MSLYFHKKAIRNSSSRLAELLKTYEAHGQKVDYPEDDQERHDKCAANLIILAECLDEVKAYTETLEGKVDSMEQVFMGIKSKTDQKEWIAEIEEFEKESEYSKILNESANFVLRIKTQIADAKIKLQQVQYKLKIPVHTESSCQNVQEDVASESSSQNVQEDESGESNESGESSTISNESANAQTLPVRKLRTIKAPSITLPKFDGNQERFPEYWAVFESLIHENDELSTLEKLVHLKESLQGAAEKAIRGIKPVPANYDWMVDTITKRFGNKTTNRSKIVQKLFELKSANKRAESCQECFDSIRTLVNQMVSAGYDIRPMCDPMWTETILKKFPYEIVKDILVKNQATDTMKVEDLLEALDREISAKAYVELRLGTTSSDSNGAHAQERRSNLPADCIFCGKSNHQAAVCRSIVDRQKRRDILKQQRRCWKCFQNSHSSSSCKAADCSRCGRAHHASVCLSSGHPGPSTLSQPHASKWSKNETTQNRFNNRFPVRDTQPINRQAYSGNDIRRQQQSANQPLASNQNIQNETCVPSAHRKSEQLVLMTAEGNVWNHKAHSFEKALFFFDTGAQKTVIEEALSEKLGLPRITSETCIMSGIGGHTEKFESHLVALKIGTAYGREIDMTIQTKPIITGGFPSVKLTESDRDFLQKSELCIANSKIRGERQIPHILVGLDRYYDFIVSNTTATTTPSGLHVAKTVFGPTVYGRGHIDSSNTSTALVHSMSAICECSDSDNIQKLFELENMGITSLECDKDQGTLRYFREYSKTITFDGNYITAPFPLKDNIAELSDNYGVAIKRLAALQRNLHANGEQMEWYSRTLTDYEHQNVIERIYEPEDGAVGKYYMPHTGVWRPEKQKPLRIVFDASSKKKGELSLNDVIHKGESFINKIHDILLASRTSNYILLCDIEAAFTQIRLCTSHKDLCRFLWLKDPKQPPSKTNIIEYRFTRIPFGVTASPSILNMAISAYLESLESVIASEIARNIYVDNILLLAETEKEALEKYALSKNIFSRIGMNLREYVSNSNIVNQAIPINDRQPAGKIKLLGVSYDTVNDRFTVPAHFPCKNHLTKREIVSSINSLYDPLGIAGPLVVGMKSLMREAFTGALGWSDRVPIQLAKKWNEQSSKIDGALVEIPRLIISANDASANLCLWLFADASKSSMATCAYIQNMNSKAISQLISGKTKLTPKSSHQTIPRLELLAILLALRLGTSVLQIIGKGVKTINIVSDSEIALCWIKTQHRVPIFVANQRDKIIKLKSQFERQDILVRFMHVATSFNPADAGTRGLTATEIANHDWVRGPQWLNDEQLSQNLRFMDEIDIDNIDESFHEPSVETVAIEKSISPTDPVVDLSRFSRLDIALRTVARVGKFLRKLATGVDKRKGTNVSWQMLPQFDTCAHVTEQDMSAARTLLISQIHRNFDLNELQKTYCDKRLIRDKDGVIRHLSRLQLAKIPLDSKSPMFLPSRGEFTRLVLVDIHRKNYHCGKDHTLAIARERFWIPKPSGAFRTYLKNCAVCKRWQGLPFGAPAMPSLPQDRVQTSKPFLNCGCDFMGPFLSKNGENMYICLYTCLTTRAVHLEVVDSLSTGAFLSSFVRFISRRGVPELIRTDCGTNFKLGSRVIEELFRTDESSGSSVMSYSSSNGVKWLFNPPASPWMGGAWERLVGSVKKSMQKSIGRKRLSFVEFCTVTTQIEAVINTRPLTKLSTSCLEEIPLRPIDFLQGNIKYSLPESAGANYADDLTYDPDLIQTTKQACEALEYSSQIANKFWERWSSEYLTALREIQKSILKQPRHIARTKPEIGEIVLIEQEMLPRGSWCYGKIIALVESADGGVRSLKIMIPNGKVLHRPMNKVYPLEIRSTGSQDQNDTLPKPPLCERQQETKERPARQSKLRALERLKTSGDSVEDDDQLSQNQQHGYSHFATASSEAASLSRQSFSFPTIGVQTLVRTLLIMCALSCKVMGQLHTNIECVNGAVKVWTPKTSFQLCFDHDCQAFIADIQKTIQFELPPSPYDEKVRISMEFSIRNESILVKTSCTPPSFCDYAGRMLSTSLIGNPHCWPVGAIMSVGIIIYAITALIMITFWIVCRMKRSEWRKATSATTRPSQEVFTLNSFSPIPLSGRLMAVVCVMALCVVQPAATCQNGYMRQSVDMVCGPKQHCSQKFRREILFNTLQKEQCIEIRQQGEGVGFIKLTMKTMRLECVKVSKFFTRETELQIHFSRRCPQMGSCVEQKCDLLRRNETVPELESVSHYPGYSGCQYSCGGLLCAGCLLPLPSCNFYRVSHVPRTEIIYEILECAEWKPVLHLEVETKLKSITARQVLRIDPYISQSVNGMNVTVIALQKPVDSMLSNKFAISDVDAFIVPDTHQVAVECKDRNDALNSFHKCNDNLECVCSDGASSPNHCKCPDGDIGSIRHDAAYRLPIRTPFLAVNQSSDTIAAETDQGEVVLVVEAEMFVNSSDYVADLSCDVQLSQLRGCYSCQQGSELTVSCRSTEPQVTTLYCESQALALDCGPDTIVTTKKLHFDSAIVRINCFTACAGSHVHLPVNGTLVYHHSDYRNVFEYNAPKEVNYSLSDFLDITLPDLQPLLNTIRNHWKAALVTIGVTATMAGLTYLFGPIVLLTILKILLAILKIMLKIAKVSVTTAVSVITRLVRLTFKKSM